jgi:HSP20 family molecular chaperone IbpA
MNILKNVYPSYFPTVANDNIQKWISDVEQMFKQPIKQVFPYPIDIKRVYSKSTGNFIKLEFEIALAGVEKDEIKVQLKKNKFLTIKIERDAIGIDEDEDVEYIYSSKALTNKNGEITFKIFTEVDTEKFKPSFKNGILKIELYSKEQTNDDDVIEANID